MFSRYLVSICCVLGSVVLLVIATENKECKKALPLGSLDYNWGKPDEKFMLDGD